MRQDTFSKKFELLDLLTWTMTRRIVKDFFPFFHGPKAPLLKRSICQPFGLKSKVIAPSRSVRNRVTPRSWYRLIISGWGRGSRGEGRPEMMA